MLADFKNEFTVLKNLNHPHITRILDFGYDEKLKRYYFTSEFIEGKDLFAATEGRLFEQILEWIIQALRALAYLHSYGIHHFDLKAANLLVGSDQSLKMIDFGLASMRPPDKRIGTPSYMAPEIINRERPDGRADLYSLGVLFYYCLTRQNPFRASGVEETLQRQQMLTPPLPSKINKHLPRFLDPILMRLLEKNPANRFPHATEVIREINHLSPKKFPLETAETLLSYIPEEGRFIGRESELQTLKEIFEEIYKKQPSRSQIILISAERGCGKSRLLKEMKYHAQLQQVTVQAASCREKEQIPDWLAQLSLVSEKNTAPRLFILDDAELLQNQEEWLTSLKASLSRLSYHAGEAVSGTLVLVGVEAGNPFLHDSLEGFVEKVIPLQPFTKEEFSDYIVSLTGLDNPPPLLRSGLYKRTGGTPLFVTEVLKSLIRQGALFDAGGRWKETMFEDVGVDFSKIDLPENLEELLFARYRTEPPESQILLQVISVFRRPVSLLEIAGVAETEDVVLPLSRLVQGGTLSKREIVYEWTNLLMGEVIYKQLSQEESGAWHEKIAGFLESQGGEVSPEETAFHKAHVRDPEKAILETIRLGNFYLERGRGHQATQAFGWGLQRLTPKDPRRPEFLMKLGEAYLIHQEYPKALQTLEEAEAIFTRENSTSNRRLDNLLRIGGTYFKTGYNKKAKEFFSKTRKLLQEFKEDHVHRLICANFEGAILFQEGKLKEAESVFLESRKSWHQQLSTAEKARVTNNDLGLVTLTEGKTNEALRIFREDLDYYTSIQDELLMARNHYNIAEACFVLQEYGETIDHYKKVIPLTQKTENWELLFRTYNGLGNVYNMIHDEDNSAQHYQRGLELSEKMGDLRSASSISINLAIIENKRKDFQKALGSLKPALFFFKKLRLKSAFDWNSLARGLLEQADIERQTGNFDKARASLDEALVMVRHAEGMKGQVFWILQAKVELLLEQGKKKEAKALLAEVQESIQEERQQQKFEELLQKIGGHSSKRIIPVKINGKIAGTLTLNPDFSIKAGQVLELSIPLSPSLPLKGKIEDKTAYDPTKCWDDYKTLILAKAYQASHFRPQPTAKILGIGIATLYRVIRQKGLMDENHPFYRETFHYQSGKKLREYLPEIFKAALAHARQRPYRAIALLKVSPGFFYKIMKIRSSPAGPRGRGGGRSR